MTTTLNQLLAADKTLAVVRAERISDAAELAGALARGGIRTMELTFTTPNVLEHIRRVADTAQEHGVMIGVGTVLSAAQAEAALDAGAQFLVTPGLRTEVAAVARERQVPFSLGALTPTEVAQAVDLGSEIVKIFPARHVGPGYLKDLLGPFPELKLLPSGGINEQNAADFLAAGALAVCCGTSVVHPTLVAEGAWEQITQRAQKFTSSLG
ncbi:2-dehydro-3-deoxyphosphogluconate aldolase [Arthrobacter sp. MYb211]|uniref:bifunctional 4-hydroxy-2-oxoglutarate aldolase/2-dehydro-3-deoxy-phosphogluconate aldolase n=1 Tax=unclassified Arthrobacter TaxID=235627 RepID=UPI000CFB1100|nr:MULTISPECIES: bifunctional 4-hydroxy-2-oxoglutarate aldolase/2-dehydro-3-deoxy-phosphogluconate aldolase [unclassified Arthrobacter]PQZ98669.1 2-dehydro-3-deoxyphosphogluconate aldolase [Arthrobacter sp. MYb224]PRA03003.1 2-dehydro-3-deoxyphosphogluconate aldolase [Arthrobacter sp. MYb229]PRA11034.1 2-dehydro-3-deoxyphosphogluconate aldolase [Arthrobacter sp. MYb221]PRB49473.1 2-dehydro-3-deoxyphosphogluconate aldolase [Arthrobacter sp. MYb216]PRC07189.1 2-dehydro-3-deoxyphosphogluconate al